MEKMQLVNFTEAKIKQNFKGTLHQFFFFFLSILGKIAETVKRPVIARGEERGRNEQAEDRGFLGQ